MISAQWAGADLTWWSQPGWSLQSFCQTNNKIHIWVFVHNIFSFLIGLSKLKLKLNSHFPWAYKLLGFELFWTSETSRDMDNSHLSVSCDLLGVAWNPSITSVVGVPLWSEWMKVFFKNVSIPKGWQKDTLQLEPVLVFNKTRMWSSGQTRTRVGTQGTTNWGTD